MTALIRSKTVFITTALLHTAAMSWSSHRFSLAVHYCKSCLYSANVLLRPCRQTSSPWFYRAAAIPRECAANTRARPAPGILFPCNLLPPAEKWDFSSETPAWLKVKPYSFWPVLHDPSPDAGGTDTLQSNAVCVFSVHCGVRLLEPV